MNQRRNHKGNKKYFKMNEDKSMPYQNQSLREVYTFKFKGWEGSKNQWYMVSKKETTKGKEYSK